MSLASPEVASVIHAVLLCYENPDQTLLRWERDVLPALERASEAFGLAGAVTVVDNSAGMSDALNARFRADYVRPGTNLQYGPGINLAVRRRPSAFTVYACTRHGRAFDSSWMTDLLAPLVADPRAGLAGCLWGSNSPEGVADATGQAWVADQFRFVDEGGRGYVPQHVQGGVFAARTEVLLRFPYDAAIPHLYTDHLITWRALKAGYRCADVPGVRSVWRDRWREKYSMDGVKYLHDDEHT